MVNADSRKGATHGELVTLREYVDMRFESIRDEIRTAREETKTALAAADKAVAKAETASDKRFEGVNEFRAALSDSSRMLMPRAESEAMMKALSEKIEKIDDRISSREERSQGRGDLWGWIVGAVGALLAVVAYLKGGQ